jgi:DNA mismatch repair ATPase MutS
MIKGCFVPANKMRLGLMDKLFVKIHTGMFYIIKMIIG